MNTKYKNVVLGKNAQIGEYVVLGVPPKGKKDGELKTVIGDNAVIRSHSVIYAGNVIGDNFQTGHGVVIREENTIGNNVSIGSQSNIEHHVKMGDDVRIHSQAFIPELSVLKKGAWIGPRVCVTNAPFPSSATTKDYLEGVTIEENGKVGANSTLLPGVSIGKNSLVGAGSVVTKDVPDGKLVVG
ncbi:MAG: DapH/DapD/GlmU-related protein, partial [Candidatus Woesearchaeota archaeon]|nr:DapH/DapD/GlmU-related protein [Candidatus Woesearchaeota archaeon]